MFSGLATGNYRLQCSVDCPQILLSEWYADGSDFASATPVPVTSGHVTGGIDFNLEKGGEITGTVFGPMGESIIGGVSRTIRDDAGGWVSSCFSTSGDTFRVTQLHAGSHYLRLDPVADSHLAVWYSNVLATSYNPLNESGLQVIPVGAGEAV